MKQRWTLGENKIFWKVSDTGDIHADTIEMAGLYTAAIVTYGNDEKGRLYMSRSLIFPMLRTIPNDTHASLTVNFDNKKRPEIFINGCKIEEILTEASFDGILSLTASDRGGKVKIIYKLMPCYDRQAYLEHISFTNVSAEPICVSVAYENESLERRGTKGIYEIQAYCENKTVTLAGGEAFYIDYIISARKIREPQIEISGLAELAKRYAFTEKIFHSALILESPNRELNCEFNFAKLRAAESIFDTGCGPLHGPGGGSYYAAVWANDEVEYAGPFFPFLGYDVANAASRNAYDLFRPFMGKSLYRIPSSIIAEGNDIWEGAGDRGDAAMYLYGASRFLLALGDKQVCKEYFEALDWCVRYCRKNLENGVIKSDSDELENRFPAGKANLCTNSLAYAGLISASDIAALLGYKEKAWEYTDMAAHLKENIEAYFGGTVSGYSAYKYYESNDVLRAWICIPLAMGILERKDAAVEALLSERLWGADGLVSQEGDKTFWDRSTLYALRGIFNAGYPDRVYEFFKYYTEKRLLGEHVPYPVEAYPEGNQRHLSAESALYARIITEGIIGITPRGIGEFDLCPSLPSELEYIRLKKIKAFGSDFEIEIRHSCDKKFYHIYIRLLDGREKVYKIAHSETVRVIL